MGKTWNNAYLFPVVQVSYYLMVKYMDLSQHPSLVPLLESEKFISIPIHFVCSPHSNCSLLIPYIYIDSLLVPSLCTT